ncbi:2-iminobutanoate/2-iminopropanoate deaminase-like [Lineus longissimus]|uniref:2-iminobutanoate/2-iminopropanoate deaminase-like n=1 Tax=Lineus longissimus TaxID=88925 RepID=UPI002B4C27E7
MAGIIRRVIASAKAPAAIGPYSQAVQVNETLYISGQLGLNPETMDFISDDVAEQTKQALTNMGAILEAAGSSYNQVVKTTILLADLNDYKAVNDIYAGFFKVPYPARAAFQCAALPKLGKVEIEAVAIVGDIQDQ